MKPRYPSEIQRAQAAARNRLVQENIAIKKAHQRAIELLQQNKPGAALQVLEGC